MLLATHLVSLRPGRTDILLTLGRPERHRRRNAEHTISTTSATSDERQSHHEQARHCPCFAKRFSVSSGAGRPRSECVSFRRQWVCAERWQIRQVSWWVRYSTRIWGRASMSGEDRWAGMLIVERPCHSAPRLSTGRGRVVNCGMFDGAKTGEGVGMLTDHNSYFMQSDVSQREPLGPEANTSRSHFPLNTTMIDKVTRNAQSPLHP